ncbi:MAG: IS66 family insertion sequence element accessory protein TnpB [Bacteroidota bacterium]|nr:IS66 family insertion sequence element accessory protein TnpB [Bacteroidota bacterium]
MFALTSQYSYYLYREPTDMRKSFTGLSSLVLQQLHRNPASGEVFLFINRRRDMIKLLRFEGSGFILYYKRLEQGTFELPMFDSMKNTYTMNWTQLVMMIEGISLKKIYQRKRYSIFDRYQQNAGVAVHK